MTDNKKPVSLRELLEEKLSIQEEMARGNYGVGGYSLLADVDRRINAAQGAEATRKRLMELP